jgi:hypothetical protein
VPDRVDGILRPACLDRVADILKAVAAATGELHSV